MPPARTKILISLVVGMLCFVYAALRYVVFGPLPVSDLPLLIANKALSLAVLCWLLQLQIMLARGHDLPGWLRAVLHRGADAHMIASVALLGLGAYSFVGTETGITMRGGAMVATGILALLLLRLDGGWSRSRTLAFYLAVLLHLGLRGVPGWVAPSTWHGGLPPISLLAAGLAAVAMGFALRRDSAEQV